ncbi:MAG: DUF427 domain-containing protein [Pseudomonadota bacterium]
MTQTSDVTMVASAIHNPAEPRHFMRLKPVERRVRVLRDGNVIAETANALRVLEVGKDIYDPVLYLPPEDVKARLTKVTRSTHCPLKGDASYYDLVDAEGQVLVSDIAWSYADPLEFAADLSGRIAFYANHVTFEESPL